MASKTTYSETLRNPYTGENAEITATTENALQDKIDKQIKKIIDFKDDGAQRKQRKSG